MARTPTNVLELHGAFAHNPQRAREREGEPPTGAGIGEPPEGLTGDDLTHWHEIVRYAPKNVLCEYDRLHVEHMARLLTRLRRDKNYTDTKTHLRFEAGLARLGMTPADRSRVKVIKEDGDNPFAEFDR